jgi:hypothetical protein
LLLDVGGQMKIGSKVRVKTYQSVFEDMQGVVVKVLDREADVKFDNYQPVSDSFSSDTEFRFWFDELEVLS